MIKISPSILSADFSRLGEECAGMERAGADMLHIDVMDGHFVPNLTIGPPVIRSLRSITSLPFDVHLMVEKPSGMVDAYLDAGADIITFHIEAEENPMALIEHIRASGAAPSVSIRPGTPASALFPLLGCVSMVLVMTVEPGFAGQKMIESCLEKAAILRREADFRGLELDIEADGGISAGNISLAAQNGVNIFVAGSAVFNAGNPAEAVKLLRKNALAGIKKAPRPR